MLDAVPLAPFPDFSSPWSRRSARGLESPRAEIPTSRLPRFSPPPSPLPPHPPWLRPLRPAGGWEGCLGAARAPQFPRAPALSLQSGAAGSPRGGGVGCGGRARAAPARSRRSSGGGSGRDGGGGGGDPSPVAESHIRVLAVTQLRPPRRCDPSVRQTWRR